MRETPSSTTRLGRVYSMYGGVSLALRGPYAQCRERHIYTWVYFTGEDQLVTEMLLILNIVVMGIEPSADINLKQLVLSGCCCYCMTVPCDVIVSIQTGDVLNLLERIDNDWFSGENTRTGSFGDFPASSVRVVVPLP